MHEYKKIKIKLLLEFTCGRYLFFEISQTNFGLNVKRIIQVKQNNRMPKYIFYMYLFFRLENL